MRTPPISLRLLSGLLVGILLAELVTPRPARADLNEELNKLFQQWGAITVNQPGVYESQRRGYISGGGLSVRIYRRPLVPVLSFSRPRLEVGCNGVDLYLGAFSYVKLDQFIRMLQQLGMSVVAGFAFKLAMKTMCETCANVLDNLENAIRQLNALMNINPCRASLAQVEDRIAKVAEAGKNLWASAKTAAAEVSDMAEGFQKVTTASWEDVKQGINQLTGDSMPGNVLYNALSEQGVDRAFIELLMSAVGVLLYDPNGIPILFRPTLQPEDLIGSETEPISVTLYRCTNADCTEFERREEPSVEGLKQRVSKALQAASRKLIQRNEPLTAEETKTLSMIPVPVFEQLQRLSANNELAMTSYVTLNTDYLAALMAYEWMRLALQTMFEVLPEIEYRLSKTKMLPDQRDILTETRRQLEQERRELTQWISTKYQQYLGVQSLSHLAGQQMPLTSQGSGIHRIVSQPATSGK